MIQDDQFLVRSVADLATAIEVNRRTVAEWKQLPDFPARDDRKYHVLDVMRWQHQRALHRTEHSNDDRRRKTAQAELAELELQERRVKFEQLEGRLFRRDAALRYVATALTAMRDGFTQLEEIVPVRSGVPEQYQESLRAFPAEQVDSVGASIESTIIAAQAEMEADGAG